MHKYLFYKKKINLYQSVFICAIVLVLDLGIYFQESEKTESESITVGVLHSSTDVRTTREFSSDLDIVEDYLKLSKECSNIDFLLWPENAIKGSMYMGNIKAQNGLFFDALSRLKKQGVTNFCSGAVISDMDPNNNRLYYNTVVSNDSNNFFWRSKQFFVPYEEQRIEHPLAQKIATYIPKLDNIYFEKGVEDSNFKIKSTKYAPLICFEVLYSNYIALKAKNTGFISLSSNESWFKNPYFCQLMLFHSICRAVENSKHLLKSSNDGYSAIINPKGEFICSSREFKASVLKAKIYFSNECTLYAHISSWLESFFIVFAIAFFVLSLILYFKN